MNAPTRVAVGTQALPFSIVLVLLILAEAAFAFIVFAVMRPHEPLWWLLSGIVIALSCVLLGEFAYGRRNWDRTTHLELGDGRVAFVPSRKLRRMGHVAAEASFPTGGILEYHIRSGDRYFTGDHDQFLRASLWIAESNGTKRPLLSDVVGVNPKTMASNLLRAGVPFRFVKVYESQTGENVESNVTAFYTQRSDNVSKRMVFRIFIGTANLWLGTMSAFLFHDVVPVVAIGLVSYFLIAIGTIYSKTSKRTACLQVATMIPVYAAGYGFAVITVWSFFRR